MFLINSSSWFRMIIPNVFDVKALLVFTVVFVIVYIYRRAMRPDQLPDGPETYPFIGNLDLIWSNKKLHKTFVQLRKKYGDIYTLQMGFYPAVVISNLELIKEAFIQNADKFNNRPNHYLLTKLVSGDRGIINNHGPLWKVSRRMAISSLRDFGVGKTSLDLKLHEEAHALVEEVGKNDGKPYNCDLLFAKASTNIICAMLFNLRYDYDDPELVDLVQTLSAFFEKASQTTTYNFLPYLLPFLFLDHNLYNSLKLMYKIREYLKKQIKQHRQTYNPGTVRDFVDIYLEAEREHSGNKAYVEQNLFASMFDLFVAGSETTSTTMKWAILFMIRYPDVQEKCRKEILKVVGKENSISFSDQGKLPYVEATICEIQRVSNIVPHSVFHCTNGSVKFHGYTIPDKSLVIPDIYSIHMDPELWDSPNNFNPARFLNELGRVEKPSCFLPFSIGRRICAGENLAKTELFIFFSSLVQKYKFKSEEYSTIPGIEDGILGVTLSPASYNFVAEAV